MFDVDWSDPNRESVGDRQARKRKERESNRGKGRSEDEEQDQDKRYDHQRSSQASACGSVRSSVSSLDKQFGLFGGKHRKRGRESIRTRSTKAKSTKTQSSTSSALRSPTIAILEHEQEQQPWTAAETADKTKLVTSPASPRFYGLVHPCDGSGCSLPRKHSSSKFLLDSKHSCT